MKINNINTQKMPLEKMLSNIGSYVDKAHKQKAIKPKQFACDLYVVGKKCNTPEQENIMNNFLIDLADKMVNLKQENLASIIYSFLIKFNTNNIRILKQLLPKALAIAKLQKDSVHVAARTGELCDIYKAYQIHGTNYLACLNLKKQSLSDICANYDNATKRFRTISRQINSKDTYIELLIRTKCDIAEELIIPDKHKARKELLSAYKDFSKLSEYYKTKNEKTYCGLKKYISKSLTDITLCQNNREFSNVMTHFSKIRTNLIEATKENAPIENSVFDDYFGFMYDKAKEDSLDNKFLSKSLELVDELENIGNPIIANRICNILKSRNQGNIKNLKTIILKQMEIKEKEQDDFGIIFFGAHIQKLFKENPQNVSVNSYLRAMQMNIKALTNIVENYDIISTKRNVKPKEEYIRQLIFSRINTAKLQKNTHPEYARMAKEETINLINKLPIEYIAQHPEIEQILEFIKTK